MTPFRKNIPFFGIAALSLAYAGEPGVTQSKSVVDQATNAELQLLHGTWEGTMVGDKTHQKITITITGNSLHFYRDTNFWFETTITLPPSTDPKQMHATIKKGASSVGQVVVAIFKVEDEKLTLATGNGDGEAPKGFEATGDQGLNRYELRKVQPPRKAAERPASR